MSEMTLFGNKNTAVSALLAQTQDNLTDTLAGGAGGTNRRISIEGGVWREIVNGKEVRKSEERGMKVVLVNAAPISRMYFAGTYVKGQKAKPACWSPDTKTPDASVPAETRQATRCDQCPQNVKGSGAGDGRACRFQQRLAVVLADDVSIGEDVYQLIIPGASIFGDAEGNKMGLQAYGRHLRAHGMPSIGLVTEMKFDTDASTPKLLFRPVRPLEENEVRAAMELQNSDAAIKAITMTVAQMDRAPGEEDAPPAAAGLFDTPAEPKEVAEMEAKAEKAEAEEVVEPKKVVKKTAPAPESTQAGDLADIVGDWDD